MMNQQIDCPCRLSYTVKDLIKCTICSKYQHRKCINGCLTLTNYECPSCQIKCSDPYIKSLLYVLEPSLLKYSNKPSLFKSNFITPADIPRIVDKEYSMSINKKFFILRCLRIDNVGFEHHWPMNCSLIINGKLLKYFSDPKELHRSAPRKDYPFVFYFKDQDFNCNYHGFNQAFMLKETEYFFYDKLNTIEIRNDINKNPKDVFSYVVSIELVEVIKDVEEVISRISIIDDLNHLKQAHKSLGKSELEVLNEKVSFVDCYTVDEKRIKIPARSINCQHMTVFDLRNFLLIRRNKSYNCPFCKAKALRIYVDGFIRHILEDKPDMIGIVITNEYNVVDYELRTLFSQKEDENNKKNAVLQLSQNECNKNQNEIIDIEKDEDQEVNQPSGIVKVENNSEETGCNNQLGRFADLQVVNLCDDSDTGSDFIEKEITQKNASKRNIFLVNKSPNFERKEKSITENNRNINIQITNYAPMYNTQSFNNLLNQKKDNNNSLLENRKLAENQMGSSYTNSDINFDKLLEKTFYPNFTIQMRFFDFFDHLAKSLSK